MREVYRVTPVEQDGLELALMPAPGETFQGAVLSLSVKGAGTFFPRDGSPALNIGERTTLRFAAPWLSEPLEIQATVRSRVEMGLFRRYGFEFEIVEGSIPEHAYRLFNRRRAVRVQPPEGEAMEVTITSSSGSQVSGLLTDISATGIGVLVVATVDVSFAGSRKRSCHLSPPAEGDHAPASGLESHTPQRERGCLVRDGV